MRVWEEIGPNKYRITFIKGALGTLVLLAVNIIAFTNDWLLTQLVWAICGPLFLLRALHTYIAVIVQRDKLRGKIPGEWDEYIR